MSDMNYLFRPSKVESPSALPSKRLAFGGDGERTRDKCRPRSKTRAVNVSAKSYSFAGETPLGKRFLPKSALRKEMAFYNNQELVILTRKVFFGIVLVVLFNLVATRMDQGMVVANLLLVLSSLQLRIGWDCLGSIYYVLARQILQLTVYLFNFHLIYQLVLADDSTYRPLGSIQEQLALAVLGNAGINYMFVQLCSSVVSLRGVENEKRPYRDYLQQFGAQISKYFISFRTVYYLARPLITITLAYHLAVTLFTITTKNSLLFTHLYCFSTLRAFICASLVLHLLQYLLRLADRYLTIQLLRNTKEINLNLLRLDPESNHNNRDIMVQIEKYVWRECQGFWDIDFLAHRYSINYQLLEEHIIKTLQTVQHKIRQATLDIERQKTSANQSFLSAKLSKIRQIYSLWHLMNEINRRVYIFFIIEHIVYFERTATSSPLNVDIITRKTSKVIAKIKQMERQVSSMDLRMALVAFRKYLTAVIEPQEQSG